MITNSKNWKKVDNSNLKSNNFDGVIDIEETNDYSLQTTNKIHTTLKFSKKRKHVEALKGNKKSKKTYNEEIENTVNFDSAISPWNILEIHPKIISALKELKFYEPTEIQAKTISSALKTQSDIIGCAQTGSGKTLAFGIPIVDFILKNKMKSNFNPQALVLTPTRELAVQIREHILRIVNTADIKVECIVGGIAQVKQERIFQSCPEIVVATPGRLWQLIQDGFDFASKIRNVRFLVIDEADRMIGKDYFEHFSFIIDDLNSSPGRSMRRTFVFSATMTFVHDTKNRQNPNGKKQTLKSKLKSLVSKTGIRRNYTLIDLSNTSFLVNTLYEQKLYCKREEKDDYLYYILESLKGRSIVFTNSKDCTRRIAAILRILSPPNTGSFSVCILHADMLQKHRFRNIERFRAARGPSVLVATDVASRGLDIEDIENVIHYQVSTMTEIYVHRSGRTARADKSGCTITIVGYDEHKRFLNIQHQLNRVSNMATFEIKDFDLLKKSKERVSIAVKIMKLEHTNEKTKQHHNWIEKYAHDAEIDIIDMPEVNAYKENGERADTIRILRNQLRGL